MRQGSISAASAATTWARAEVRRRWRALTVLGVLVGLTGGVVVAALVGSRQNDGALRRLRETSSAHDLTVFASQTDNLAPDWTAVQARPEVEDLAVWLLLIGEVDGEQSVLFAPGDDRWLVDVNRPVVTAGRMYDASAPDEIVVSDSLLDEHPVGSTIEFVALGSDVLTGGDGSNGPHVSFRVVGGVRTISQFLFTEQGYVSPGFVDAYEGEFLRIENADLILRSPDIDVTAIQEAANEIVFEGTPIFDLNVAARRSETTLGVESGALLILAAVIAIAGSLLIAQAAGRSAASIEDDATTLGAMGMTNADLRLAVLLTHLPTLAVAAVTLFVVAVASSALFPVGLGRDIHPDVGVHVAWTWVLPALLLTLLLTVAGLELAVLHALRRRSSTAAQSLRRPITALQRVTSVPVAIGLSMAFDSGTGPRRTPVRPALVAAVVGVAGVIGTLAINAGIDDALAHPELAGQVSDIVVGSSSFEPIAQFDPAWVARIEDAAGPGAETATFGRFAASVGGVGTLVHVIRPTGDDVTPSTGLTLTSGRAPVGPGEIALGPKTAEDIGASVGDLVTIDVLGTQARVVGIALFPPEVHGGFDDGAWLHESDYDQIATVVPNAEPETWLGVNVPDGREAAALESIESVVADGSGSAARGELPIELANLRNVRTLPLLLAGFLTLLAIASLAHVLMTGVRRRARDFAVLRALGTQRRPTQLIVNAQSTGIAAFGLLVGVPLGVLIGREGWRWVATRVPLDYVPPFSLIPLLVIVPAAIVVVNALALWPGHRIGRQRPADHLRTE